MLNEIDARLMEVAKDAAKFARCKSKQIGAAVYDGVIYVIGSNGPPITECKICPRKSYGSGEGTNLCQAIHAEMGAVLNALEMDMILHKATLYCYCGIPCKDCMKEIVYCGIRRIVCLKKDDYERRSKMTDYNFDLSKEIAEAANVEIIYV